MSRVVVCIGVLVFGTVAGLGGCTPTGGGGGAGGPADREGTGEADDNAGEPADGEGAGQSLDLSIDDDPDKSLFARVRDADGTEFAIFAEKEAGGTVPAGRPATAVNTLFADGALHKAVLDTEGRPVNIDTPDFTAGIVYRTGDGGRNRILLVNRDGTDEVVDLDIDETVTGLDASETAASDPRLCDRVERHVAILEQIVEGCSQDDPAPRCREAFRRLASASRRLCTLEARETEVEIDAQVEGLSAGAQCTVLENNPGVADLDGLAAGGTPPYSYEWEIIRAAPGSFSEVEDEGQFSRLTLETFGEYILGLTVTDAEGRQAEAICIVEREVTEAEQFTIDIVIQEGYEDEIDGVRTGSTLLLEGIFRVGVTEQVTYAWSRLPTEVGTFEPAAADINPIFLHLSEDYEGVFLLTLEAVRSSDGETTESTIPIRVVP